MDNHCPSLVLQRDEDLKYKDWVIPKGTVVSEIPNLLLLDPKYFPEPDLFFPERWIEMTAEDRLLRVEDSIRHRSLET